MMTPTVTSKPLYVTLALVFLMNCGFLLGSRATLDVSAASANLTWLTAFGLFLFCLNRVNWQARRLQNSLLYFCEAMVFSFLVSLNLPLLNHLTMMIPFPLQDEFLSDADLLLGLNWVAYFELVHSSPMTIQVLEFCYNQLSTVGLFALIALAIIGDAQRMRFYIEIFFFTAVFCIIVGAGFPALAAVNEYIPDLSAYSNFPNPPGVYHLPHMETLRDPSSEPVLSAAGLAGLVTFPSYHTASGVLLAIAFFRTLMFWPAFVYSALMIASSPVFGGHYFIDMIAGAIVAILAAIYFARKPRYAGLFTRKSPAGTPAPQMA